MSTRRVTLERAFERFDGSESVAELTVDLIEEPATRWDPGCNDVEPVELLIDGRHACMHENAAIVSEIIEMEDIPAPEEF